MSQDVSTNDLMQVMKEGFARMDTKFQEIDDRFKGIDARFDGIDNRFNGIDQRFEGVNARFTEVNDRFTEIKNTIVEAINILSDSTDERFRQIEAKMVTKDHLDEKLFDLRGDAVALIRRHEQKLHLRTV